MGTAHAEHIWLTMDQVRPIKLATPADSIVIGNPAIADVKVQDGQNLLLFGKAPGLTNIYVFDEETNKSTNYQIRVRTPSADMLVMHRGLNRTTYNCTVVCEETITVGDSPDVFSGVSSQVDAKLSQAKTGAGE